MMMIIVQMGCNTATSDGGGDEEVDLHVIKESRNGIYIHGSSSGIFYFELNLMKFFFCRKPKDPRPRQRWHMQFIAKCLFSFLLVQIRIFLKY